MSSALTILADHRLPGFTGDELAAHARVGKAAIYRRWDTIHALLVDLVATLGVRDINFGPTPGTTADDVTAVLTAACTGVSAMAEAAVLPLVGLHDDLREAYFKGPQFRLSVAGGLAAQRALDRDEIWPSLEPIRAGHALLLQRMQVTGLQPAPALVTSVAEAVLPGLLVGLSSLSPRRSAVETDTPSTAGSIPGGNQ
jgi:AcrR family transcriptional regulator